MKTGKISLLVSLLLLFSANAFSQKKCVEKQKTYNVQENPLSDDTTNPVNKNFAEFAEIDLDDNNENHTDFTNFNIPHFNDCNLIPNNFICASLSNSITQYSNSLHLKTAQSYLSVFRI